MNMCRASKLISTQTIAWQVMQHPKVKLQKSTKLTPFALLAISTRAIKLTKGLSYQDNSWAKLYLKRFR